ncbi:hypothetical protein [Thalassovita sp.]|uniref:hypothetical protein n=1 Tax=Thalassovita sp. TaxID=1979401 RepID=UPI002B2777CD|nr:hypothetical protein [Thalassovita sp.]
MDYSRMGGVKPTYGKNKPRLGEEKGPSKDARNDKAKLLERMKKAAEAAKAEDNG